MNKNIEKEYKILLNKDQFDKLCEIYEPLQFIEQTNTYYDTISSTIQKQRGAMRIRTIGSHHIFTLKMHENSDLLEYECDVNEDSLYIFNNEEIASLLKKYNVKDSIIQVASLKTKRAIIDSDEAEFCFDINYYNGICDYEIEYEYKKDHDGLLVFNKILEKIGVQYEKNCKSKIARALGK